ncbi:HEPN domain-containing protein [Methanoregula sp.]|uniref:HEPN domain-containing protein n=1 Tax=Methanoregula sp. TaxID=2052170 RepID=UPI002627E04F|nr:HEPN domain-containing protein [Methanoregula sp.]MDD5141906.1 HEPN domain-containing protein [Methanoregula sp.]
MPARFPPDDPREWLNRAHSNLSLASTVPRNELYLEDLCYNAQQAAEKAIKAVCISYDIPYPYVHDLAALVTILMNHGIVVPDRVKESAKLTRFAVATRYPRIHPPVRLDEYQRSLSIAGDVVRWAETIIREKRS